jgi:signal transduction histidine kinase
MPVSLSQLHHEARRLRFADRELEECFLRQRVFDYRLKARWLIAAAMLVNAMFGLYDASRGAVAEDVATVAFYLRDLSWRFFVMTPSWLVMWLLTFLPTRYESTLRIYPVALAAICSGLVLLRAESVGFNPLGTAVSSLFADQIVVLLGAVVVTPVRFRGMLGVCLCAYLICLASFGWLVFESDFSVWLQLAVGLGGLFLIVLVATWWRESDDRLIFAQQNLAQELNRRLEASNSQLVRLNEEKSEFMAIAAHDLKAPLATVRGFAELLRAGRLRTDEARANALEQIESQSARMLSLVSNYLGHYAINAAELPSQPTMLSLVTELERAVQRNRVLAEQKEQDLRFESAGGEATVQVDTGWLAQILDNLISNALKFSPAGSPIVVRVMKGHKDAVWRVEVKDSGPGLSAAEQALLFRRFGRSGASVTAGESSHGLGLTVVKRLVERMCGTLGVESERGAGATFWFELPAASSEVKTN